VTPRVRHLYRSSSLPVNLQHADEATPPLTSPELAASATDDEEKGMATPMTPLRRASEMKLTSSIIQATATSTVRCHLRQGGHVFVVVCLSVSLLATLCKNFRTDLHEILSDGWQWATEQTIKFWWPSGSPSGYRDCLSDSSLLGDTESGIIRLSCAKFRSDRWMGARKYFKSVRPNLRFLARRRDMMH